MSIATETMPALPVYEMSREQEGCWEYHCQLSSEHEHQLITTDAIVRGLHVPAMRQAIEMLIRRHESLRTYFVEKEGLVMQCVVPYDDALFAPRYHDVSDRADARAFINEKLDEARLHLRKLDKPPLIICNLFKAPDDYHYICVMMHHIIADSWSSSIVLQEMTQLYAFLRTGEGRAPEPLRLQLKDYAMWQRKWLAENGDSLRDYWCGKLSGVRAYMAIQDLHAHCAFLCNLREDDPLRLAVSSNSALTGMLSDPVAGCYSFVVGEEQFQELMGLSAVSTSSIATVMNAAFQLLFHLRTGRDKILLAMPVINRFLPGTESIIGCLGGAVYLYQPIDEELPVRQFIRAGYLDFLESAMKLIYTYEELCLDGKVLRLHCDAFVNYTTREILPNENADAEKSGEHRVLAGDNAYYALSCYLAERPNGLSCVWKHNLQCYPAETIVHMARIYHDILRLMCSDAGMPVKRLKALVREKYANEQDTEASAFHL